jgi:uncharacterized LabA/DUF88 family protein
MEKIALLIDAENISASYASKIFDELNRRGSVIVRRAYADWTKAVQKPRQKAEGYYNLWEVLSQWYSILPDKGITPMHQPQNTYGKNSSDIYLIIDAMDLLYEGVVDTFAIVSSDGDFTRLGTRLMASGKKVIVLGESQTPSSVRNVAEFILLEEPKKEEPKKEEPKKEQKQHAKPVAQKKTEPQKQSQVKQEQEKNEPKVVDVSEISIDKPQSRTAAAPKPATPKKSATDYDKLVIGSIEEIIKNSVKGEVTYQKLLSLLRKKYPECDTIKVGESPIELFKKLPNLKYRLENATYLFSLKESEKVLIAEVTNVEEPQKEEKKEPEKVTEVLVEGPKDVAPTADEKADEKIEASAPVVLEEMAEKVEVKQKRRQRQPRKKNIKAEE